MRIKLDENLGARRAVEQLYAQTSFERGNRARYRRRRHAEAARAAGKTFGLGHRHEHVHQMQPVHALFHLSE